MFYRCVRQHLETWLAQCHGGHQDKGSAPPYGEREFRRYLDCGILAHGFARAHCGQCGHDFLIAFSCKGRGVCPSCYARRMVATAAHLTDRVLPPLPVRQWVLAVPTRLRYFLHRDAGLQGAALRLFLRAVEQCLRAHSPGSGPGSTLLGAIAIEQLVLQQQRLCGDGTDATWAEQPRQGDEEVDREDEDFAHVANATILAGGCKTARKG